MPSTVDGRIIPNLVAPVVDHAAEKALSFRPVLYYNRFCDPNNSCATFSWVVTLVPFLAIDVNSGLAGGLAWQLLGG